MLQSPTVPGHDSPSDVGRIRAHYAERGSRYAERWSDDRPEVQFAWSRLQAEIGRALAQAGVDPSGARILDLGCGSGRAAAWLGEGGARCVVGVDVVVPRLREASQHAPRACLALADGALLPLREESFDVALALTALSSMPSEKMRQGAATELLRVIRPGGAVICYEFAHRNPLNPYTVGLGPSQLRALFQGVDIHFRRVTLNPLLLRAFASWGTRWLSALERFRFLRSHHLALVTKPSRR